jgi:hypothetical protein
MSNCRELPECWGSLLAACDKPERASQHQGNDCGNRQREYTSAGWFPNP